MLRPCLTGSRNEFPARWLGRERISAVTKTSTWRRSATMTLVTLKQPRGISSVARSSANAHIQRGYADVSIALGIPRGLASPITFPLPKDLSQRLQQITSVVYQGRGFVVLRGVDPSRYTAEERVVMYAGITSYVADTRARNIGKSHFQRQDTAAPAGTDGLTE